MDELASLKAISALAAVAFFAERLGWGEGLRLLSAAAAADVVDACCVAAVEEFPLFVEVVV